MATQNKSAASILNLVYDVANKALTIVGSALGLASDATQGSAANDTIVQIGAEAKDFDGSPLPNAVDEGDAVRISTTLSGTTYAFLVNEDGSATPVKTDDSDPGATPSILLIGGEYRNVDSTYTIGDATIFQTDSAGKVKIAGYDTTSDLLKSQDQSPLWSRYTDAENLVTTSNIGATDNTWVNQGSEINVKGFTLLGVWCDLTVNDSTGNNLQILSRHTASGSDYVLETAGAYQKTLGDASVKILYIFDVKNITGYVQVQTLATDVDTGGGTIGTITIDITKGWS